MNFHLLIIGTESPTLDRLAKWLSSSAGCGYTWIRCEDPKTVQELIAWQPFDLIVFAADVEDTAILEVIGSLCTAVPDIPVLVVTPDIRKTTAIQIIRSGAQDCLALDRLSAGSLDRICCCVIERARYKTRGQSVEYLFRAAIDSLSAHIAILDNTGKILSVNKAWQDFVVSNGASSMDSTFVGTNCLHACADATGNDTHVVNETKKGIQAVIAGSCDIFELDYPWHDLNGDHWFHLRVTPFAEPVPRRVVVARENITARKKAEMAQQRSNDLFEKIFAMAPIGLWLTDTKGRLLRGNSEAYRIWRLTADTRPDRSRLCRVYRLPSRELIPPDKWSSIKSITTGATIRDELLEVVTQDEKKRTILNYTAPLVDSQGKIEGGLIVNLDITSRTIAQEEAETSMQRIQHILNSSPNCLFIKDRHGRYVFTNLAAATLLTIDCRQMIGRTDEELNCGYWQQESEEETINGGEVNRFTAANGSKRWLRCFNSPIIWGDNERCELTIAMDITETYRAREQLRNSEEQKRLILDSLACQVVMLDRDLQVLWSNRTMEGCGSNKTDWPIHCYELNEHDQQLHTPCADCPILGAFETSATAQTTRKTSSGSSFSICATPVSCNGGKIQHVVVTTTDITERLSLEQQLRQAQKMESLGILAGGIAHDFNNILAALLGYADLASTRLNGQPKVLEYLQQVAAAGKRATELVQQILTFSRRKDADRHPLHIPIVVREALKLLRSTLPTTITIKTAINTAVDRVMADPTQIHQIIMNLCVNASHAMEPAGGTLTVSVDQVTPDHEFSKEHPALTPGSYLRLQVIDSGCGMPREIMDTIFDPYFTTKSQGEGTGLGLAVVHGIVKQYRGEIVVDSIPGKGSTFTIFLPVVSRSEEISILSTNGLLKGREEHILFVDDEPLLCKFYQYFLQEQGYRITTRTTPEEALTLVEQDPTAFDLVLSDMTMPGMTGDQLGKRIMMRHPDLPVLLMTGYTKILSNEQAREQGFCGLLFKPIPQQELLMTLRTILDRPHQSQQ